MCSFLLPFLGWGIPALSLTDLHLSTVCWRFHFLGPYRSLLLSEQSLSVSWELQLDSNALEGLPSIWFSPVDHLQLSSDWNRFTVRHSRISGYFNYILAWASPNFLILVIQGSYAICLFSTSGIQTASWELLALDLPGPGKALRTFCWYWLGNMEVLICSTPSILKRFRMSTELFCGLLSHRRDRVLWGSHSWEHLILNRSGWSKSTLWDVFRFNRESQAPALVPLASLQFWACQSSLQGICKFLEISISWWDWGSSGFKEPIALFPSCFILGPPTSCKVTNPFQIGTISWDIIWELVFTLFRRSSSWRPSCPERFISSLICSVLSGILLPVPYLFPEFDHFFPLLGSNLLPTTSS